MSYGQLQERNNDTTNVDSTQIVSDSNKTITDDDTVQLDTVNIFIPLYKHGSISLTDGFAFTQISRVEFQEINYSSLFDIIDNNNNFYPLFLGTFGYDHSFSVYGAGKQGLSATFNNRTINSIDYGSFYMEQIAPEFLENIEILTGSDAVIFADNSQGALINVQEIRYNVGKPYTRLWVSQAGSDFLALDGIVSQNIVKNWNVTLGLRRSGAKGYFDNSDFDAWNIRALVRWNPSDLTSFSFTEIFTNHFVNHNGGIDPDNSKDRNGVIDIFNPLNATTYYNGYNERNLRHDITLSTSQYFTTNKVSSVSGNIYFTNEINDNTMPYELLVKPEDSVYYFQKSNLFWGANARYEQNIDNFLKYIAGGDICYYNSGDSQYFESSSGANFSGFFYGELSPTEEISLTGGGRVTSQFGFFSISWGAKANFIASENFNYFADISMSRRHPTISEGLGLEQEKHFAIISGLSFTSNGFNLGINAFYRYITDPIVHLPFYSSDNLVLFTKAENADYSSRIGGNIKIAQNIEIGESILLDNFILQRVEFGMWGIFSSYDDSGVNIKSIPMIYAGFDSNVQFKSGKSTLKIGLKFKIIGSQNGEWYVPQTRSYFLYNDETGMQYNGIDLYISARLGNAFVKADFRNLLGNGHYYIPIYPEIGRNFRLSVAWAFLD